MCCYEVCKNAEIKDKKKLDSLTTKHDIFTPMPNDELKQDRIRKTMRSEDKETHLFDVYCYCSLFEKVIRIAMKQGHSLIRLHSRCCYC